VLHLRPLHGGGEDYVVLYGSSQDDSVSGGDEISCGHFGADADDIADGGSGTNAYDDCEYVAG
jgi:hypothetical protein